MNRDVIVCTCLITDLDYTEAYIQPGPFLGRVIVCGSGGGGGGGDGVCT